MELRHHYIFHVCTLKMGIYLFGRKSETEKRRDFFYLLICFPSDHNGQDGTSNSFWVSRVGAADQALGPPSTAFADVAGQAAGLAMEQPGLQPDLVYPACQQGRWWLNAPCRSGSPDDCAICECYEAPFVGTGVPLGSCDPNRVLSGSHNTGIFIRNSQTVCILLYFWVACFSISTAFHLWNSTCCHNKKVMLCLRGVSDWLILPL